MTVGASLFAGLPSSQRQSDMLTLLTTDPKRHLAGAEAMSAIGVSMLASGVWSTTETLLGLKLKPGARGVPGC